MVPGGQYIIEYKSRTDVFKIWLIACVHYANKACAIEQFKADMRTIAADPYSYWIGMGDLGEFIGPLDKRFDPLSVAPYVEIKDLADLGMAQMRGIRDIVLPAKDKCMGLIDGNHEYKYEVQHRQFLTAWLAGELDAPYLGATTMFDIVFRRRAKKTLNNSAAFRTFAWHGAGNARTPGAKLNMLVKKMKEWPRADLVFMAHVHDKKSHPEVSLDGDRKCDKIVQHKQLGVITGSYLRTYAEGTTTYGERKGYAPVVLGPSIVTIKPDTRETGVL